MRAAFGMHNELQDALGYRMDQNAPFNPTYSIASLPVSKLAIHPQAPTPATAGCPLVRVFWNRGKHNFSFRTIAQRPTRLPASAGQG